MTLGCCLNAVAQSGPKLCLKNINVFEDQMVADFGKLSRAAGFSDFDGVWPARVPCVYGEVLKNSAS